MNADRDILAARANRSTSRSTLEDRVTDILTFRGAIAVKASAEWAGGL